MPMTLLPLPAFSDNYIWTLGDGERCLVVDPGEAAPVLAAVAGGLAPPAGILLTHHHPDHVGGVQSLLERWPQLPVFAPRDERIPFASIRVGGGDPVALREWAFETIAVPGHTSSHVAFVSANVDGGGILFCGDTLFSLGCGRMFEAIRADVASLDRLAPCPAQPQPPAGMNTPWPMPRSRAWSTPITRPCAAVPRKPPPCAKPDDRPCRPHWPPNAPPIPSCGSTPQPCVPRSRHGWGAIRSTGSRSSPNCGAGKTGLPDEARMGRAGCVALLRHALHGRCIPASGRDQRGAGHPQRPRDLCQLPRRTRRPLVRPGGQCALEQALRRGTRDHGSSADDVLSLFGVRGRCLREANLPTEYALIRSGKRYSPAPAAPAVRRPVAFTAVTARQHKIRSVPVTTAGCPRSSRRARPCRTSRPCTACFRRRLGLR